MEPAFGWTLLSRDALRRAEMQLRDEAEGVRDEVGFLGLHQAYADRFFPGTSVQHTRLRYALFVPWLYEAITRQPDRQRISAVVERHEIALAGRLKSAGEAGVIGGLRYPHPTTQPPTMVYWSALGTWRILRPMLDGSYPSRQSVHRAIARKPARQQLHDDDKQLLVEDAPVFCALPSPPTEWRDTSMQLDFRLTEQERRFLRGCMLAVVRPGPEDALSLLARLAERRPAITAQTTLWSSLVRDAADQADRQALVRARQAAALAAIGRGVYAALLEEMRESADGVPTVNVHRTGLKSVVEEYRQLALALDVSSMLLDVPTMSTGILEVLQATQSWLKERDPMINLHEVYERAEARRKGRRARLTKTLTGRERRAEWLPEDTPPAEPLHFRWTKVRQLLLDLE